MAPSVLRSKSAPVIQPLSARSLPKNVSFSALEAPVRPPAGMRLSKAKNLPLLGSHSETYHSSVDSPLTQRVEAFNLSGGFFPTQADEYDWLSAAEGTPESFSRTHRTLSSGLQTPAAPESPVSSFSSLPATPGAGFVHRPLPDELDHMATEAIESEDKMGVLKITARGLSALVLNYDGKGDRPELPSDVEPLSDDALYSSLRARRQEATTPINQQPSYGELFLGADVGAKQFHGWTGYLSRVI